MAAAQFVQEVSCAAVPHRRAGALEEGLRVEQDRNVEEQDRNVKEDVRSEAT